MKRVLAAWLLVWSGFAPALEVEGNRMTLTDAELAQCRAEGGCVVWTRKAVQQLAHEAHSAGRASCGLRS